tara:strand:- start:29 stop:346 length:318 start_codon:yes stop_codon:yes gene_type:complete
MTTKCRKCGNLKRKDGKPCAQPCPVDEYGEPCSQKTTGKPPRKTIDKAPRVFMEERAKRRAAIAARMLAAQQRRHREERAKKRSDAQELAQAKAKKPKLMREIEQ